MELKLTQEEQNKAREKATKKYNSKRGVNYILSLVELTPKKTCVLCGGRGTILMIHPNLTAKKFRMVVPCPCVRKAIDWKE